jgi:hypothetical protein
MAAGLICNAGAVQEDAAVLPGRGPNLGWLLWIVFSDKLHM